jgi:NitT/TauT family transport system substrate-binding protein
MARRIVFLVTLALALVVAAVPAAAPSAAAPTPQLTRVGIGFSNVAAAYAPLWIAERNGLFRQYGLDVDIRNTSSGAITMAALASGDIQVAYTGGPGAVNAALAGGDIRIFGGYLDRMPFQLVARSDIQSVLDLRGRVVAMNRAGGAGDFVTNYVLRQHGLEPNRDVTLLQLGAEPERVAALTAGAASATVVNPPFDAVAQQAGLRVIFDTATLPVRYSLIVLAAQRSFLDRQPQAAQGILQATQEALRLFKADRELATSVLRDQMRITDDALLTATWEYYRNAFSDDLEPRGLALILDEAIQEVPQRAGATLGDVTDLRLLSDLRAQGRLP